MNLREAIDELEHWLISTGYEITVSTKDGIEARTFKPEDHQKVCLALMKEQKEPYVYVNQKAEIFFNQAAKKYAVESEVRDAIELLLGLGYLPDPPLTIVLTNSLRELAEMSPNTKISHLEGTAYPYEMK